jgi:hypothetical protein
MMEWRNNMVNVDNNESDDSDDQFLTNNSNDTNPMDDMKKNGRLPEDNATPFSPPDGVQDRIDDSHQIMDTEPDSHEHYDEGIEGASGVDFPGVAADEDQNPPV